MPSYALGLTVKRSDVPVENNSNECGKIEIDQLINHHQRGNREHIEKQQAEAAVHQHFEESLKLAQQQRVWISNIYYVLNVKMINATIELYESTRG